MNLEMFKKVLRCRAFDRSSIMFFWVFLAEFRNSEKSWITACISDRAFGVVYNLLIKVRGKMSLMHIAGINSFL